MANPLQYGARGKIGPAPGFSWDEVRCTDGSLPTDLEMRRRFAKQARNLNKLRAVVKKEYGAKRVSITVNSWYRSGSYNQKIGGARFSQHVAGRATDIVVHVVSATGAKKRLTPARVAELAARVRTFRLGGIGVYDAKHGNFTHLDHRPDGPARWFNG